MSHPIKCMCGSLKGSVVNLTSANRCVCYCKDCQSFAHFLEHDQTILNDAGGTDILQTSPGNVRFSSGIENLACIKLSEKGLLRWYARCCNTPIGNTPANMKIAFVGLVHNCLNGESGLSEDTFGPVRAVVNTGSAVGEPKSQGMPMYLFRVIAMLLRARVNGSYKETPFFNTTTGEPIVSPKVLNN